MGLIDKPLQFLVGVALIAIAFRALPRRRWRRSHGVPLSVRIAWVAALAVAMLIALLAVLDATRFATVNICLDLWEGQQWCNHEPEP